MDPSPRPTCPRCRKAALTCYCAQLRPFTAPNPFVILQHPDESRNAIATARMAHLSITNSALIVESSFGGHPRVAELLAAPGRRNVLLYPRPGATDLDELLQDPGAAPETLVFWVIDAKWARVAKMLQASPEVAAMPAVTFASPGRSLFSSVRVQPRPECLSTLEAIHHVIDRVKARAGDAGCEHDALLDAFRHLLRQQLEFVREDARRPGAAEALRSLSEAWRGR